MENNCSKDQSEPTVTVTLANLGQCPIQFQYQGNTPIGVTLSKNCKITPRIVHNILQKLTATKDDVIAAEIYERAVNAMPNNFNVEHNANLVLQALSEYEPKDASEARLCLQANVLYAQGMQYLSRAENQDMIFQAEHYMKFAIKLLRLHNETLLTLQKLRKGGEQKIVVQHMNIENSQTAFIGNFHQKGGEKGKIQE